MKILSIGGFSGFGTSNTCLLRNNHLKTLGDVDMVDTTRIPINLHYRICNKLFRLGLPIGLPDLSKANESIINYVKSDRKYDLVWIDKGVTINPKTLKIIKLHQPDAKIVGFSPDWMGGRHNQSKQFIESLPYYDCYVTTKSYSVPELYSMGATDVMFVDNSFQKGFHKPYELTDKEHEEFDSIISFIGSWEKERSDMIEYIASNGIVVNVWGSGPWSEVSTRQPNVHFKGSDLMDERFCKALTASKISLCFLRKVNKDLQTTRSVEIPACGSMMLAERTEEHQKMFEENKEAVYFSSKEELLDKCRYFMMHEDERKRIADAGYDRCVCDDYSYDGRINSIISHVFND